MLVGPAAANPGFSSYVLYTIPPWSWVATGTGFVYKNGFLKYGPATIYVNWKLTLGWDSHLDNYSNPLIGLVFPYLGFGIGAVGFWWRITQTSVLPNGNLLFYAVPLTFDYHGLPVWNLFLTGPGPINVVILPPLAGFGERQYVTAFGLGAYFNGWTLP
jgi:hypothetical protein